MNTDEYLQKRVDDQIGWYDTKSATNKKLFVRFKIVEICAAVLIPFVAGLSPLPLMYQIMIGGLGVIIAIAAGVSAIYKFHENWIEYRNTAENLKQEKFLFVTNAEPYTSNEAYNDFVHRVEGLISSQHSQWAGAGKKQQA